MQVAKKKKKNKNGLLFVYVKKKQYLCSDYGLLWANAQKKVKNKRIINKNIYTMNLSELTNKLYAEGVEKGNAEAAAIVAKAQEQAAAIVAKAEKEAAEKLAAAEAKLAEMDKNTRAELKLFAEQSVSALKTEVTNLLTEQVAADSVKAATADAKFMQGVIAKLAEQMAKDGDVTIEAKDAEALKAYFAANAKGLLEKGVKINEVKGIKTDFAIVPEKGGYKLNFGEKEFVEYFKEFLRPQLIEVLF
jgi:V/A-type H+-transporting ATPase subunit E